jgi:hypothetical protein
MHCSSTSVRRAARSHSAQMSSLLAFEIASIGGIDNSANSANTASGVVPRLAEDVAGADHGVLNVGAGLALEAQRILEVEGDDGVARELEHEVAQRADGDLLGDRWRPASSRPVWRASTSARWRR